MNTHPSKRCRASGGQVEHERAWSTIINLFHSLKLITSIIHSSNQSSN